MRYNFYILIDRRKPMDPFYLGLTTRDLRLRLREHIYKAKWSMKPEVKNHKGEKDQYERMVQIGWDNVDIVLLLEKEFETRKKAMSYETELIMGAIASGHDLVNVVQRKKAVQQEYLSNHKSRYNPNSRYRKTYDNWTPPYFKPVVVDSKNENIRDKTAVATAVFRVDIVQIYAKIIQLFLTKSGF